MQSRGNLVLGGLFVLLRLKNFEQLVCSGVVLV